jgi:hypothetical protein
MSEKVRTATKRGGKAPKGPLPKKAYISAPSNFDTRPIRKAFEAKGVQTFSADQLELQGLLSDVLHEGMQRADFVVAVVAPTPASDFVLYEMGYGRGMGKPVFVLLTGNMSPSLLASSGLPYFTYNPGNPSALDFAVQQILAASHHGKALPTAPLKRTKPIGRRAEELLSQLRKGSDRLPEQTLEDIIGQAIRESGVTSLAQPGDVRPIDFVVWSADLAPWVGNPLAIEIKQAVNGAGDVNLAVGRLMQAMSQGAMPWGLFIYGTSRIDVANAIAVPNILSISAENFLEALRTMGFSDIVLRLRNQRVHGGPGNAAV